jgi:hypothetical protein
LIFHRLHAASWRGRQSVGHEVDADLGVARIGPQVEVNVAEQTISGVGAQVQRMVDAMLFSTHFGNLKSSAS